MAQTVRNLAAMQKTWVGSLSQEDPLETEMATHSSIPAWRISWTEEPGRLQSMRLQTVGHDWATNTFTLPHILKVKIKFKKCSRCYLPFFCGFLQSNWWEISALGCRSPCPPPPFHLSPVPSSPEPLQFLHHHYQPDPPVFSSILKLFSKF